MAQQIIRRLICQDSTPTSYTAGDVIEVFYNDTTDVIEVEVNDTPVSSGEDIYENYIDTDYFSHIDYYYQFCDGSNLQTFPYSETFPYAYRSSNFSESCSVVVCDIAKSTTTLTPASGVDQADGSIYALATSSNTVKYALYDFDYNTEGQTSPTHSGLLPGTYTVYAKDSQGCSVVWTNLTVTYDALSTYGAVQRWTYYSKDGTEHRVDLLQRGAADSPTQRDLMDATPTLRRYRGELSDNLATIFPGEIDVFVMSETDKEYLELIKEADDKEYLIKQYYKPSASYDLIFQGFVTTTLYSEPYRGTNYVSTLNATDRLGDLSKIDFSDDFGSFIYGDMSVFEILRTCLKKTGMEFGYRIAMNLYEANHDSDPEDDPLTQTYLNTDSYYTDGEPDTCYEVLEKVLNGINCEVRSYGGYWYIIYKPEKYTTYAYRQFDKDGNYESNSTIAPRVDLKADTESNRATLLPWPTLQGDPVYKNININSIRKLKKSIVTPFEERTLNGNSFLGWSKALSGEGGSIIPQINPQFVIGIPGGGSIGTPVSFTKDVYYFNFIINDGQGGNAYIVASGDIEYKGEDEFSIKIPVIFYNNYYSLGELPYVKLKYSLKVGSKYYTPGGWSASETVMQYFLETFNKDTEVDIRGVFDTDVTTNTDTTFELRIYDIDIFEADYEESTMSALLTTVSGVSTSYDLGSRLVGRVSGASEQLVYFELQINDSGNKEWIKTAAYSTSDLTFGSSAVLFRSIEFITYPNGQQIDDKATLTINTKPGNVIDLEHDLHHFDLDTTINNTENLIANYFKLSDGTPTSAWGSSGKKIQRIHGEQISGWFSKMPYRISGEVTTDLHLAPYNVFREINDDNRIYNPVFMEIDDKRMKARIEMVELQSDDSITPSAFTSGFKQNAYR